MDENNDEQGNLGSIELITGCMFSGKTEELFERMERSQLQGNEVILFKPEKNNQYDNTVKTRDGKEREAVLVNEKQEGPREILAHVGKENVVGIDGAHLFSDEIIDVVEQLAQDGKRVIVSGLDQTYRGEPFEPVPQVMALADYVDKLHAVCEKCGNPATKSQRIRNNEDPAHTNEETIVLGSDIYEPRCREHHVVEDK